MPEDVEIKEADPPTAYKPEAEGYSVKEQDKVEAEEKLFNSSTITVVLQLMPVDDHPRGRLGLLSVRNDNDAPLFDAPIRGEILAEFLNVPSLAGLIEELKHLLLQRQGEREAEAKAKEQAVQIAPRPPSGSARTATEKGKTPRKTAKPQPQPQQKLIAKSAGSSGTTEQVATDNNPTVPQSVFTPEPVTEEVEATEPVKVKETPRQLTLF